MTVFQSHRIHSIFSQIHFIRVDTKSVNTAYNKGLLVNSIKMKELQEYLKKTIFASDVTLFYKMTMVYFGTT